MSNELSFIDNVERTENTVMDIIEAAVCRKEKEAIDEIKRIEQETIANIHTAAKDNFYSISNSILNRVHSGKITCSEAIDLALSYYNN